MNILKLLSEEVFDFSSEQMTTSKARKLKTQLCTEFSDIFRLCYEILEKAQKASLLKSTFEAFYRFLRWIPLGYIFETKLAEVLVNRFIASPEFRNVALGCFTEICNLPIGDEYSDKIRLFSSPPSNPLSKSSRFPRHGFGTSISTLFRARRTIHQGVRCLPELMSIKPSQDN